MTGPITIEKLELTGFRAYLKPQTFQLRGRSSPFSLAVFAPNGIGKSSLVDSLEYYFSKDGTLKRLGQRSSSTQAGLGAVRHVDAEERNVETSVSIRFRQGVDRFGGPRPFSVPLTDAAKRVLNHAKVPFVIRGYELRQFIDGTKPVDRYKELVTWFELDPLLAVQENLRKLKLRTGAMAADTTEANERLRDLVDVTDGAISAWNEPSVLDWLNGNVLAALDKPLRLEALSDDDPAFQELESLERAEQESAGHETLGNLLAMTDVLYAQPATPQEDPAGLIPYFEKAVSGLKDAAANEDTARSTTNKSAFKEVWESARDLLGNGAESDECPVCCTDFASSPFKSRSGVYVNLGRNLSSLEEYRKAEAGRKDAEDKLGLAARDLGEALGRFSLLAGSAYRNETVAAYREALRSWEMGEKAPDGKGAAETLARLHASISADIGRIERQQGKHAYRNTLETARRLLAAKAKLERIGRTKGELKAIQGSLDLQAKAFGEAIVGHVQSLVDGLQDETGAIYKDIQGPHARAPPIRIKLADEGAADQRSAKLLIDFADNCKEAMPGGFLSDSQIHTLALALRLAAIRMFNAEVKMLALDDIVTSYDADRRKNIAGVLGDRFADFQIILVTHDEHFFDMLRGQLPASRWLFKRIKDLRDDIGPIFDDHKTRDEEIEARLAAGENAGADIRIAEEEWLTRICYEFGTPTTFQRNHRYTNSELAESLSKFLKAQDLTPPKVPGFANDFLSSLQSNVIENFSSHFNDNMYKSASPEDARGRWDEFKYFRSQFVCRCGHSRFVRPLKKPLCAKCETPFSFGS